MRNATLALVLTCGLSFVTSIEAQTLQTDQDKTFYALGLAIGSNVKEFKLTAAELALEARAEKGDTAFLDKATNEEEEVLFASIKRTLKEKPGWYSKIATPPRSNLP